MISLAHNRLSYEKPPAYRQAGITDYLITWLPDYLITDLPITDLPTTSRY